MGPLELLASGDRSTQTLTLFLHNSHPGTQTHSTILNMIAAVTFSLSPSPHGIAERQSCSAAVACGVRSTKLGPTITIQAFYIAEGGL